MTGGIDGKVVREDGHVRQTVGGIVVRIREVHEAFARKFRPVLSLQGDALHRFAVSEGQVLQGDVGMGGQALPAQGNG